MHSLNSLSSFLIGLEKEFGYLGCVLPEQESDSYSFSYELPLAGVKKEDIEVLFIESNSLYTSALNIKYKYKGNNYSYKLTFGTRLKESDVKVSYSDGLLSIKANKEKAKEETARKIKVD